MSTQEIMATLNDQVQAIVMQERAKMMEYYQPMIEARDSQIEELMDLRVEWAAEIAKRQVEIDRLTEENDFLKDTVTTRTLQLQQAQETAAELADKVALFARSMEVLNRALEEERSGTG